MGDKKRNTDYFTKKTSFFKPTFQLSKNTTEQQKFLTMFSFQPSKITQKDLNN